MLGAVKMWVGTIHGGGDSGQRTAREIGAQYGLDDTDQCEARACTEETY